MASWVHDYLAAARSVARDADELAQGLPARPGDVVVDVHAYAWPAHEAFVRRYCADGRPRLAAFSMNPARNGAVQTGIAFTDARTARELLPDLDRLANRPAALRTERVEMSGRKLRAWAEARLGGLAGLYRRVLFPIACPLAVLRGPRFLNVPLASLSGGARRAADAFYEAHAPRLVRAIRPRGVLLFGDYAAQRWRRLAAREADLRRLPSARAPHPAARIENGEKFRAWDRALARVEGVRS